MTERAHDSKKCGSSEEPDISSFNLLWYSYHKRVTMDGTLPRLQQCAPTRPLAINTFCGRPMTVLSSASVRKLLLQPFDSNSVGMVPCGAGRRTVARLLIFVCPIYSVIATALPKSKAQSLHMFLMACYRDQAVSTIPP